MAGLKISIEQGGSIRSERQFAFDFPKIMRDAIWTLIRRKTFTIVGQVKRQMPVDTGRARADWGHVEQSKSELETIQGSTLVYVPRLNEGHSQQAPAGFIDTIALVALQELVDEIAAAIDRKWQG